MTTALLPIHPEHVASIFAGQKRVEFRRRAPARSVDRLLIYETAPRSCVVAVAEVVEVVLGTPEELWRRFGYVAGVTAARLLAYLHGASNPCGIRIGRVRCPAAADLAEFGIDSVPQTWRYPKRLPTRFAALPDTRSARDARLAKELGLEVEDVRLERWRTHALTDQALADALAVIGSSGTPFGILRREVLRDEVEWRKRFGRSEVAT